MRQSQHTFKFQTQDGKLNWEFFGTNWVEGPMESHKRDSVLSRYNPSINEVVPSRATASVGAGQQSPAQLGRGLRENFKSERRWLDFFCTILEHFCPLLSHFAQMWSQFAENTTTNPCSLLSYHKPLFGYVHTRNIPNHIPKTPTPFSWPEVESGQNELLSGQNGP